MVENKWIIQSTHRLVFQSWRPLSALEKTYKIQKRKEDRQSGINPEEAEVDFALAYIIERFEEAQKIH